MIEFFPFKKDIPFMRWGKVTTFISLATFIFAVAALAIKGLNFGVDFTGGTVMEVAYKHAADLGSVRSALEKTGLPEISVQTFGTSRDVLIRLPLKGGGSAAETSNTVIHALKTADPTVELKRVDFVGPQVGKELYDNGALALLVVAGGILAYLAIRFEWRFALAAIVAAWVMMVRLIVVVMALSMMSGIVAPRILRMFSRIRSNTTTDSLTE